MMNDEGSVSGDEGLFSGEKNALFDSPEYQSFLKSYRNKIQSILTPYESWVMKCQLYLVWENPTQSAILLVIFNILFWLFTLSSFRVYYVFAMCCLLLFVSHSWLTKMWPEIRVPVRAGETDEEWTPVHPALLSVPELSSHLAEIATIAVIYYDWFWATRRSTPGRFCLYCCAGCICGLFVGHFVPGRLLVYIPMLSLLLWPCVSYHSLIKRVYMKFEPLFMQLEYSMKIKRSHSRGHPRSPSRDKDSDSGKDRVETDTDSELDDFIPRDLVARTAALARVIADSEDESPRDSRSQSPHVATSHGETANYEPSQDLTADLSLPSYEDYEARYSDSNFSLIPTDIPSIEDVDRKHGTRSFSPVDLSDSDTERQPKKTSPIEFVSDYFHQDSESGSESEDRLAAGLSVPELGDTEDRQETERNARAALVAGVAAQAVTAMTQGAAAGLARLAEYVVRRGDGVADEEDNMADDKTGNTSTNADQDTSSMLSADFEFVDHEDVPRQ